MMRAPFALVAYNRKISSSVEHMPLTELQGIPTPYKCSLTPKPLAMIMGSEHLRGST
jgi:hypothetical protein